MIHTQRDSGGKNILSKNWASFLKARLNCSIPGEFPFYFNEIRKEADSSLTKDETLLMNPSLLFPLFSLFGSSFSEHVFKHPNDNTKFYAVFSTSMNGLVGSAICSFSLYSIQEVFNGKFKEQATSSSAWLPVLTSKVPDPRPGVCVNDTQSLPDTVLNFIRGHPLMDSSVPQDHNRPIFYKRDVVFTRLVVDTQIADEQLITIYFAGTTTGHVYKVAQWMDSRGEMHSNLVDVFEATTPEPVRALEISPQHKSLYVASDSQIRQFHLFSCKTRYESCARCVRDPYCGWDRNHADCRPFSLG